MPPQGSFPPARAFPVPSTPNAFVCKNCGTPHRTRGWLFYHLRHVHGYQKGVNARAGVADPVPERQPLPPPPATPVGVREARVLWQAALGELELQVSRPNFRTWLAGTTGESLDGDTLVVGVPNFFYQEWLEQRLLPHIRNTLVGLAGHLLEVRFVLMRAE